VQLNIAEMPVFILCGGLGTRLKEMTEFRPKPMVTIGVDPILLHIMKHYSSFGFRRFVLCMGYKSEIIRDYFLNFYARNSDVTIELKTNSVDVHSVDHSCDWKVTLCCASNACHSLPRRVPCGEASRRAGLRKSGPPVR
jgi:glucose-1-phosphate cytidylyltransferase